MKIKANNNLKIKTENANISEKCKVLSKYYKKYESMVKNGDNSVLDMMCLANIARADFLLS